MDIADVVIALAAAMLLGVGFVLQQHAAEQAPKAYFLRLRLITDLLHRPRWLAGLAVMIAGQLCSAWAVGHLDLSLAEPLLATNLIFALALAVPLSRQQLRATELIGAVLLSGGVAALSLARSPGTPDVSFGSGADWPVAAGIAFVAYCFVHAGRRRPAAQRALFTGIAAGLVFGISDALTRRTVQIMDTHSFVALFTSWPAYCVVFAGLIGLWLLENSFTAAPLHASLPGITAAEPLTGILLGVVVFGDVIRISPGMIALQAIGLAAIVSGVIMVARAPCLSQLRRAPAIPHLPAPHLPGLPGRPGSAKQAQPAGPVAAASPADEAPAPSLPAAPVPTAGEPSPARPPARPLRLPAGRLPVGRIEAPKVAAAAAGLSRRPALIVWILVAGYRAMFRRPGSIGEG